MLKHEVGFGVGAGKNLEEELVMEKKIGQKLQHIVKEHAFVTLYVDADKDIIRFNDNREYDYKVHVGVTSGDPYSPMFSQYLVATSMLDSHLPVRHVKQYRVEKKDGSAGGVESINKDLKIETYQLAVQTGGISMTEVRIVDERVAGRVLEVVNVNDEKDLEDLEYQMDLDTFIGEWKSWRVASRSASQTRSGDLVFIKAEMSLLEHMEDHMKFNIKSYAKQQGEYLELSVGIQSRLKMAGSSGRRAFVFDEFEYYDRERVYYEGLDGELVEAVEYQFTVDGQIKKMLHVTDDFTVRLEQDNVSPDFLSNGGIRVVNKSQVFEKPATDGSSYVDMRFMMKQGIHSDLQFRLTPVIKGMLNNVLGLEEELGYVAVFFDGAVKGDPAPYFEASELEMYVLNEPREEREESDDYMMLSNQMVRNLAVRAPETLEVLERDSKEILQKAYTQDVGALKTFIGLRDGSEWSDEEKVLDSENSTVAFFEANPEAFMQSDMLKKRLSDFIRPASREVEFGARYYAKDTSYRHMVSDPYEVVRHMKEGRMAVDTTKDDADMKGIAPGHVATTLLRDGQFGLDERKAVLGRFPLLHQLEIQVVNEDTELFLDESSRQMYESLFEGGRGQGMIYYSLYDMTAEGQSGADFDGDTTVVVRNPEITKKLTKQPLYLDYSYLDGELVEGVPWKEDMTLPIEDILDAEKVRYLDAKGVVYADGFFRFRDESLEEELVREYIYETVVRRDGLTNKDNNIGQLTNISTTVLEMITVLEEKLEEVKEVAPGSDVEGLLQREVKGYKKLNFLLAASIRWEIDKAKHGGQFYDKLPFLDFLLNAEAYSLRDAVKYERQFDISLVRLMKGFEDANDLVNKGLDTLGLERITLDRDPYDFSDLNMSNSMYLGKGIDKGVVYGSRYDRYIEEMNEMSNRHTKDFMVYESKNGLFEESVNFISWMESQGYSRQLVDEQGKEESLYRGRRAVEEGKKVNTPARLVSSYRKKLSDISTEISELEERLLMNLYAMEGGRVIGAEGLGMEALIKKTKADKDVALEGYKLMAKRELLMDQHKGLGETFTSDDPLESAMLFAELYEANVRSQSKRRIEEYEEKPERAKELRDEALSYLKDTWVKRYGNTAPTAQQKESIKQWVAEYIDNNIYSEDGWGSILTLFPLSAVQFLEFVNHNDIQTTAARGQNVVVYLDWKGKGDITEDFRKALEERGEGQEIVIDRGEWSTFRINDEEHYRKTKEVNPSPAVLEKVKDRERVNEIKDMRFASGGHFWTGKRSGRIVALQVYRQGVKLFLEDSKEVYAKKTTQAEEATVEG